MDMQIVFTSGSTAAGCFFEFNRFTSSGMLMSSILLVRYLCCESSLLHQVLSLTERVAILISGLKNVRLPRHALDWVPSGKRDVDVL